MSALVLDAGALVAVDRNDRAMIARLRTALDHGLGLRAPAIVIAEMWRDPTGRQAQLARLLRAVEVRLIDQQLGRQAGELLGRAGTSDLSTQPWCEAPILSCGITWTGGRHEATLAQLDSGI